MKKNRLFILHGPKFVGKSIFLEELVRILIKKNLTVKGLIQRGVFDKDGYKVGYDIIDIENGDSISLARRGKDLPWKFDQCVFDDFSEKCLDGADLLVLDEIGPLELLSCGGHLKLFERMLSSRADVFVVVRQELVDEFASRFSLHRPVIKFEFTGVNQNKVCHDISIYLD